MNRRAFVKLLGLTPAIAPAIARAAVQSSPLASGGFIRLSGSSISLSGAFGERFWPPHRMIASRQCHPVLGRTFTIKAPGDFLSVKAQMREHDLFDMEAAA